MASPDVFKRRIRTLGDQIFENSGKAVRAVALVLDQVLVLSTPVDTGRARSNWLVGINRPSRRTVQAGDKSGQSAIGSATGAIGEAKPGDDIWISNNLPYIDKLNRGHSPQARSGFVERAIKVASKAVAENFDLE